VTADEVECMMDLGLGRGVDATVASPWLNNKCSYQVRKLTADNVHGTISGVLSGYVEHVSSIEEIKAVLDLSVPLENKVTLGVDAEYSRVHYSSLTSLGWKVVTRNVAFDDKDEGDMVDKDEKIGKGDKDDKENKDSKSFEEDLSSWIEDNKPKGDLTRQYEEFIKHFNMTHYVSRIELGAARYEVLAQEIQSTKTKVTSTMEITKIANLFSEVTKTAGRISSASLVREIGQFKWDASPKDGNTKVITGCAKEAVIGVDLEPISNLVKDEEKKTYLKQAIRNYIAKKGCSRG